MRYPKGYQVPKDREPHSVEEGHCFYLLSDRGNVPAIVASLDEDDGSALIKFYWGVVLFEMRMPIARIALLPTRTESTAPKDSQAGRSSTPFGKLTREEEW